MKSRRHFIKASGLAALGINRKSNAAGPVEKPFIHGFNFKFKRGVPDREIASLMKQLAALKGKIPVLKEFFIGKNIGRRTHGYQYGEIAVFDMKEDSDATNEKHPEHQKLVRKILPRLEIGNGMDFFPITKLLATSGMKTKLGSANFKGHFVHAFNFKFKPGVSEDEIAELMHELAGLRKRFRFLRNWSWGKTRRFGTGAFNTVRFPSLKRKRISWPMTNIPSTKNWSARLVRNLQAEMPWILFPLMPDLAGSCRWSRGCNQVSQVV